MKKSALVCRYALKVRGVGNLDWVVLPLMLLLLLHNWSDTGVDRERVELDQRRARVGYLERISHE